MSHQKQILATDGSLLLTVYGTAGAIAGVIRLLSEGWQLAAAASDFWQAADGSTWLRRFVPVTNGDTVVAQAAMNVPGPAAEGWPQARERLESVFSETALASEGIWGYTLVYQAVLDRETDRELAFTSLSQAAGRLYDEKKSPMPQLAGAGIPGGHLWLTHRPEMAGGARAATVYLALGLPEKEAELVSWLAGPGAPMLEPDLISHKAYYLRRQYHQDNLKQRYLVAVEELAGATSRLLDELEGNNRDIDPLEAVAGRYDKVVGALPIFEEIHIQVSTQLANFDRWATKITGGADVLAYHQGQLAMARQELELLVRRGQNALEAAGTTVEMVQARLAKVRARQERRLEMLLALVAVALAVPELINQTVAAAILDLICRSAAPGVYSTWALLGLQLAMMAVIAVIVYLVMRMLTRR